MLFGTLELSSEKMVVVQEFLQQAELFCQNYWFGGPLLVFAVALIQGYRNRNNVRRLTLEKQAAVESAFLNAKNSEATRLSHEQREKAKAEAEAADPIKQGERVLVTRVSSALSLGTQFWDWWPDTNTLKCKSPGYEKVSIMAEGFKASDRSCKALKVTVAETSVNDMIGRVDQTVMDTVKKLFTTKLAELEAIRVHKLADEIATGTVANPDKKLGATGLHLLEDAKDVSPSKYDILCSDADIKIGQKMFDKLVTLLRDKARWYRGEGIGSYTDKSTILSFQTRSRTDARISIRSSYVMNLFTIKQQLALAQLCYDIAQADAHRPEQLEGLAAVLKNIA